MQYRVVSSNMINTTTEKDPELTKELKTASNKPIHGFIRRLYVSEKYGRMSSFP